MKQLDLPIVVIRTDTLPRAWERAVMMCWEMGTQIKTQYDKPGDPPSRDCSVVIAVADPMAEPRIHRCFPGGITDLEVYRQEVVDGIHDHWIDPTSGKWEYTYHERLTGYTTPLPSHFSDPYATITNQIDYIVKALIEAPHTRRAQAVTWKPWKDAGIGDPACLQRIWCRIFDDRLVMNVDMRSNDAFKAAFMNMYAFTDLQRVIAERVSEGLGRKIEVGQYTHRADSFHIYGSYFSEFEGFLKSVKDREYPDRVWATIEVQDMIDEARAQISESLEREKATGIKGILV